jgi:hypothetical protein
LSLHAKANQTDPVHRGKFVRERFFCTPPTPPPPELVVSPPALDPRKTTRERFAQHRADSSCAGCHELGIASRREAQRVTAKWSVRKTFRHATHAIAKDGKPVACTACHVDMTGTDLMSLRTPPKSTCAPCHDGDTSFKLTGTACARCHPK